LLSARAVAPVAWPARRKSGNYPAFARETASNAWRKTALTCP
jgi:hypothetical protein